MSSAHLFNPYNDLALAVPRQGSYTPPPGASAIAVGGALLPLWWAEEGDVVLADGVDREWLAHARRAYGLRADVSCDVAVTLGADGVVAGAPWGWSADARRRLLAAGVVAAGLPTDEWLTRHRQLSHRRVTIDVLRELAQKEMATPILPIELKDIRGLAQAVETVGGAAMIKLPYSTSGRGIADSTALGGDELTRRVRGMIDRQGSVMVERKYDKALDFAMLFMLEDGVASFGGYSLFEAERGVSYTGNLLMPDDMIRCHLARYVPESSLRLLERVMPEVLTQVIGDAHQGWMGVDMLLFRSGDGYGIYPCVEVNLRMTMGVVAHYLTKRFYDGSTLRFAATPGPRRPDGLAIVPPNSLFNFAITK